MVHETEAREAKPSSNRLRVVGIVLFLVGAYVLAQQSDFITTLDPYVVREAVSQWGALSVLAFIFFYAVGLLLYVPGTLFTVAGALLFGKLYGFLIVWVAANIAMNLSFILVRLIGGKLLDQVKQPLILKMMNRLDDHPIQTIIILRMTLFTAPALNTVLALCRVRGSDHFWGTLIGSIMPALTVVILTDWVLAYFYS